MRWFKRIVCTCIATIVLATIVFLVYSSDKYVVPVMMYHNVEQIQKHEPNWVSPQRFEEHMAYLKKHRYNVISLDELVESIKGGKALPHNSVVITFDDGYENNYTHAYKVLKKYDFPAVIFILTSFVGREGYLSWEQIKEMADNGVAFGAHTVNNAYLPDETPEAQRYEIFESKRTLEERLKKSVDYFAYPIGGFSDDIKKLVQSAGYKAACATNRGYDRLNKDVYELNRIRFSNNDDNDIVLFWKLIGFYNIFRKSKNPF